MTDQAGQARRYTAQQLEEFIARAFVAVGMDEGDAGTIAALMADADLNGSTGTASSALRPTSGAFAKAGLTSSRTSILRASVWAWRWSTATTRKATW